MRKSENGTQALIVGDQKVIQGDPISLAVLLNNLSGRNFETPGRQHRHDNHEQYLAYMSWTWGIPLAEGTPLKLLEGDRDAPVRQSARIHIQHAPNA